MVIHVNHPHRGVFVSLVIKLRIIAVRAIAADSKATLHLYFDNLHLGGLVHCPRFCVVHIFIVWGLPPA